MPLAPKKFHATGNFLYANGLPRAHLAQRLSDPEKRDISEMAYIPATDVLGEY
jgi:hypothetical protein